MVISWIINLVATDIVERLMFIETVQAIWLDLKAHFHKSIGIHIFQLKQNLHSLT